MLRFSNFRLLLETGLEFLLSCCVFCVFRNNRTSEAKHLLSVTLFIRTTNSLKKPEPNLPVTLTLFGLCEKNG